MAAKESSYPAPGFDLPQLYVWLKGLEGKVNNLLREVDVLKNDLLRKNADLRNEAKLLGDDLLEIKRGQDDTQQKMDLIIRELKNTAAAEEVAVIKKYLDLWNPLNFVTQRDLERAVESRLVQKARPAKEEVVKKDYTPFH